MGFRIPSLFSSGRALAMTSRAAVLATHVAPTLRQPSDRPRRDAAAPSGVAGIVVVGSCFLDYVGYVDRMPKVGETIHSKDFAKGFGGKGANQAVMAARLGGHVSMVAALGSDGDGDDYVRNFQQNGVSTSHVKRLAGSSSGLAMILVDVNTAQNQIVICPNAAAKQTTSLHFGVGTPTEIEAVFPERSTSILVTQNEIPLATTLAALEIACSRNVYTIFNTAPAPSAADVEQIRPHLRFVSCLCPNEHEASLLSGVKVTDAASSRLAVNKLREWGFTGDAVITLGEQGAYVSLGPDGWQRGIKNVKPRPPTTGATEAAFDVPGRKVTAVDTTGAGDSFVGSMAYFLSQGDAMRDACEKANYCAADSVTKRGTQSSYPSRHELPVAFF